MLEWNKSRKHYEQSAEFSVDNNLPETLVRAIEKNPQSVRDNKRYRNSRIAHKKWI